MLTLDVQTILNSIPHEVRWEDIVQFKKLNERVAVANEVCANIVGVNGGSIEWCPNDEPPSMLETFLWWWVVRPDLGAVNVRAAYRCEYCRTSSKLTGMPLVMDHIEMSEAARELIAGVELDSRN